MEMSEMVYLTFVITAIVVFGLATVYASTTASKH